MKIVLLKIERRGEKHEGAIVYLEQLLPKSREEIYRIRNMGEKSLNLLINKLKELGFDNKAW